MVIQIQYFNRIRHELAYDNVTAISIVLLSSPSYIL